MNQTDYERRIEILHKALRRSWENNHRVTSLKIAIQCSKLLNEARVPQFYPSMFVMVTGAFTHDATQITNGCTIVPSSQKSQ
jgi:hypothetical protein